MRSTGLLTLVVLMAMLGFAPICVASHASNSELDDAIEYLNDFEPGEYPIAPMGRTNSAMKNELGSLQTESYMSDEYLKYEAALRVVLAAINDESLADRSTDEDFKDQQLAADALLRLSIDAQSLGIIEIRDALINYASYDVFFGLADAAELVQGSKEHEGYSKLLIGKLYSLKRMIALWETADGSGKDLAYKPLYELYLDAAGDLEMIYQTSEDCRTSSTRNCIRGAKKVYKNQKDDYAEFLESINSISSQSFFDMDNGDLLERLRQKNGAIQNTVEIYEYAFSDQGIFDYETEPLEDLTLLEWLQTNLGFPIQGALGDEYTLEEVNAMRAQAHLDPYGTPSASNDPDVGSKATDREIKSVSDELTRLVALQNRLLALYARAVALADRALDSFAAGDDLSAHVEEANSINNEANAIRSDYRSLTGY